MELEWKIPQWSNAIERQRARTLPPGVLGARRPLQPRAGAQARSAPAARRAGTTSRCPRRRSASASTRRRAACSRTTWSSARARSPTTSRTRRRRGTATRATSTGRPGPYEDAVQNTPIFEENGPENFKGVDIMRAVHCSTRACPAACTCTARARSARSSTRRRGCADGDRDASEALIARVQELTDAARGDPGPPGPRGGGRARRRRSSSSTARASSGSSRRSTTARRGPRRGSRTTASSRACC